MKKKTFNEVYIIAVNNITLINNTLKYFNAEKHCFLAQKILLIKWHSKLKMFVINSGGG